MGKASVVRMSEPATMRDLEGDAVIDDKYDINFYASAIGAKVQVRTNPFGQSNRLLRAPQQS